MQVDQESKTNRFFVFLDVSPNVVETKRSGHGLASPQNMDPLGTTSRPTTNVRS